MGEYPGNCVPSGLLEAGLRQRGMERGGKGEAEVYQPRWGIDKHLFDKYGLVPIKPGLKVDGTKDGPSDGCSSREEVRTDLYNRRIPCGAHDYCADIVRSGAAPWVTKSGDEDDPQTRADCDTVFLDLMYEDCRHQQQSTKCTRSADRWYGWLTGTIGDVHASPGVVFIANYSTARCWHWFVQGVVHGVIGTAFCDGSVNEEFRLHPEYPGPGPAVAYHQIRSERFRSICAAIDLSSPTQTLKPETCLVAAGRERLALKLSGGDRYEIRYQAAVGVDRCLGLAVSDPTGANGVVGEVCAGGNDQFWLIIAKGPI